MELSAKFNRIIVIESFGKSEKKSGRFIYENVLMHVGSIDSRIQAEFIAVDSVVEFVEELRRLSVRVKEESIIPILHVECHGSAHGLAMADGSCISWVDLRSDLAELNKATELNLLVVSGSCAGAYLIDTAIELDRAPFFAVVGTESLLEFGLSEMVYSAFYRELLARGDIGLAVDRMNSISQQHNVNFLFLSVRLFFELVFKNYISTSCIGKVKRERVEKILSMVVRNSGHRRVNLSAARRAIKKEISNIDGILYETRCKFFFADIYPDILDRFPLELDFDG